MIQERADEVISTSEDAILSKLSASKKGYYEDPFLPYMSRGASTFTMKHQEEHFDRDEYSPQKQQVSRNITSSWRIPQPSSHSIQHQPVIRRGTHARVCVMDYCISAFLDLTKDCDTSQIVILGAGRDTTYLRSQCGLLHRKKDGLRVKGKTIWYEIDHGTVIKKKLTLLQSCPLFQFSYQNVLDDLNSATGISFTLAPESIRTSLDQEIRRQSLEQYHLVSYDLRDPFSELIDKLENHHGFRKDRNTLFVMECVQMYLSESVNCDILSTISKLCVQPFIIIFDPIIQNDPFGKVMANNLVRAGIIDPAMSLLKTRTLEKQIQRIKKAGFQFVRGCDFYNAYDTILTETDRRKANTVEILDEIEEWLLIMKHYCLVTGSKSSSESKDSIAQLFCSVGSSSPIGFLDHKSVDDLY